MKERPAAAVLTINGVLGGVTGSVPDESQQARIAAALRARYPSAKTDLEAFAAWDREQLSELISTVLTHERRAAARAAEDAVPPLEIVARS